MAKNVRKGREPARPKKQPPDSGLPGYIADAIRQAWPDGLLEMPDSTEDAPFQERYDKLKRRLAQEHYREIVDDAGLLILKKLRTAIIRVLTTAGITVLAEEDLDRPVPWLRADEEVFVGHAGEAVTVRTAFFFHGL